MGRSHYCECGVRITANRQAVSPNLLGRVYYDRRHLDYGQVCSILTPIGACNRCGTVLMIDSRGLLTHLPLSHLVSASSGSVLERLNVLQHAANHIGALPPPEGTTKPAPKKVATKKVAQNYEKLKATADTLFGNLGETEMTNVLYEITVDVTTDKATTQETHYGHKLAVNSAGQWVMELKSGVVIAVDKKNVKEVTPYSVGVVFGGNGTTYHYWAVAGTLNVGDVVMLDDAQIVRVTQIDTANRRADKWLTGFKLAGTVLKAGPELV